MRFLPACLLLGAISFATAQTPPPAGSANIVENGGFVNTYPMENLWGGVDSAGFLAGSRASVPVLTESGSIAATAMPVSVSVADMNADGLPDIVAADATGILRIYFNSGTAAAPKFTLGELASVFLGYPAKDLPGYSRLAPRVNVAALSGKQDIIAGNYAGEVLFLRNEGSAQQPAFRQPADFSRVTIPTSAQANERWGNVFAPAVWDWNRDGKPDLLLGEGSYSANNIHLALNEGSATAPRSSRESRYAIAFGDGREQLTPAVVDYNGDGSPDLLVAGRDGRIAVHLHPPGAWKPGMELPFSSFVPIGGDDSAVMKLGGLCTVGVGDLNGDGLFDIVAGKTNGRIVLILNEGTREQPKFSEPVELKGAAPTPPLRAPIAWDIDTGVTRGNLLAYAAVVSPEQDPNAAPPEGTTALKFGYLPSPNQVMPSPLITLPGIGNFRADGEFWTNYVDSSRTLLREAPSNYFMMRQSVRTLLKNNASYTLSFKMKGARVTNAQASLIVYGQKSLGDDKIVRGDRGRATVVRNRADEIFRVPITFSPGADWKPVSRTIPIRFESPDLRTMEQATAAVIEIVFALAPGEGELLLDDVQLVQAQ